MSNEQELMETDMRGKGTKKILKWLKPSIAVAVLIVLVIAATLFFAKKSNFFTDAKTTKLGFENIGELATQSVTCTSVIVESKDRKVLGISVPFTQTKNIYSYDTEIKAGVNFSDVKVSEKDAKTVYVDIPEIKILSTEVDTDSFKLYLEDESIFSPITLKEHNESIKELQETAQKDAVENGLFDKAYENAKSMLTVFIGQVYDLNEYKIEFSAQK